MDCAKCPCPLSHLATAAGASLLTWLVIKKLNCCSSAAAQGAGEPTESRDIYETQKSVFQYMEFHFTPSAKLFEPYDSSMPVKKAFDFTIRLAKKFDKFKPRKCGRVLDLGCAVGMSSFELTRTFDEVVGVDLSQAFIDAANKMKLEKRAVYEGPGQGLRGIPRDVTLDPKLKVEKCTFLVGDAMNIDPALGKFDGLLAANLVCRVPGPEKMLRSFGAVMNPGGILVLVSPYSWWDGATAQEDWIGGKPGDAPSEDLVKAILSDDFDLVDAANEPFLIRDHHRRFQLGFSHCTVWRRK